MIDVFRMHSKVTPYLHNSQDLMDRIVALTNEYTRNHIKDMKIPKIDVKRFDKGLLPMVNKLLDKRVKKPLRKYLVVEIIRDEDTDDSMLEIRWNDKEANFFVPTLHIKNGKTKLH
jgi:hypothetical protein